ncbi:MAG: phosphatidylglycerophosphatase A [Burkholderiaceae bacterium]|nr:phosphatidylglycerophosphatase A [Burkholderiaceae bacterium]
MRVRASRWIALGFGSGLSPWAPGTVGTLWAWAVWHLIGSAFAVTLSPAAMFALLAGAFAIGVVACERTGRDLGVPDHAAMVWDEALAFWVVLALVPGGVVDEIAAFVLFRFFDIVKPPPIRQADARLKGGFGVMFDDLLAAAYTLLPFALWSALA